MARQRGEKNFNFDRLLSFGIPRMARLREGAGIEKGPIKNRLL